MTTVRELHNQAMEYANLAMIARNQGQFDNAISLAQNAFNLEYQAAQLVPNGDRAEPTKSILYRSAASLAYQSGNYAEAIRIAGMGLAGKPSPKIRDDLLSLLAQLGFAVNLTERSELLEEEELLLTMLGNAVAKGVVLYSEFKDRIDFVIKLINKTVQRLMLREYQSGGPVANDYKVFQPALGIPAMQNSFSMTLKLIKREDNHQGHIFVRDSQQVIDEIIYGIDLINANRENELRQHIHNEDYYANFVNVVRKIAPDGDRISQVALSSTKREASLTRRMTDIELVEVIRESEDEEVVYSSIEIEGELRFADDAFEGKGRVVGILVGGSEKRRIRVSAGIDDLVQQYFGRRVKVVGRADKNYIYPTDIVPLGET